MSVLNTENKKHHTEAMAFLDEGLGMQRYDVMKYKQFDNYTKAIDKIQSYGISVNGCFILGFDSDTKETFLETEKFIKESNLTDVQITLLTPFPQTDLYLQLQKEGRLLPINWNKCTLFDVMFVPKNFTVEELENEFQKLMTNIYTDELVKERKERYKKIRMHRKKLSLC